MPTPDPTIRAALDALGLPDLKVVADPGDLAALSQRTGWKVSFADQFTWLARRQGWHGSVWL